MDGKIIRVKFCLRSVVVCSVLPAERPLPRLAVVFATAAARWFMGGTAAKYPHPRWYVQQHT